MTGRLMMRSEKLTPSSENAMSRSFPSRVSVTAQGGRKRGFLAGMFGAG